MKRFLAALLGPLVIGVFAVASQPAAARGDVDIHIGIPAPPVVTFRAEPEVVIVPETRVYYVPHAVEYDMYRYGPFWYVNQGGHWYRSKAYRGPFAVVEFGDIPHAVVSVPGEYRHHPRHPHGKRWKHERRHHRHHDDDRRHRRHHDDD